ncbi:leucine-rich repeat neuronal protein 4 [Corythoichthys intestinalis]|uniref:leucine-rich repeat neuronal protein 4 n=1 Tax=Corythoichthys intestinalis TaxID=161448 RepID=UPI0025A4EE9B|nr:leucine-rich repeat neuronal protein 4 [Corythoichthys intestinalis]
MAANRNVLMMVICLLLLTGSISQATTNRGPGTNRTGALRPRVSHGLEIPPDEYYDTEDDVTTIASKTVFSNVATLKRCDYNPCKENEPPCAELSATNNCLCPGSTSHLEAPRPPFLKTVTLSGSEVVLQWCAPHSFVKAYKVTVGGTERQTFESERRSGGVGPIENVSEVCLVATNDVGDSEGSCMMYRPGDSSLPIKAALIGGALSLLLLLLLAILLWRRRRQRRVQTNSRFSS